jgi:starch synthase
MGRKKLRIFIVAAEVAPFSSVGGLSQVMYFLPRELTKMGHDVRVFTPKYGTLNEKDFKLKMAIKGLDVPTGEKKKPRKLVCNVKKYSGGSRESKVYFLENMEYYEKRSNVYGYSDDHIRFALLSRGALEFLRKERWIPDVIHVNDWHTGYLVNYLRTTFSSDAKLSKVAALLSIHNLHQGVFDFGNASDLDFDDGKGSVAGLFSDSLDKQNSLKRGIIYADAVSTVSETHSREIMTKEFGAGLHNLIKEVRTKVFGILNGLDNQEYNPKTDKLIKKNYSLKSLEDRVENKVDLQKEFDLEVDAKIPLLAMIGRLDNQKGLDLITEVLPFLLKEYEIQFIAMGGGDPYFRDFFLKYEKKYPKRVGTHLMPNFTLPRKIFAGTDVLLLPSRWEPGGIVAIEGMRYGAVPLVRKTGGLADSVIEFEVHTGEGTGFTFEKYHTLAFMGALTRALMVYKQPKKWRRLVRNCMRQDFSWHKAAKKYEDVYFRAIGFRKQQQKKSPHQAYRIDY